MKTTTIEAKTLTVFETLEEILTACKGHQFTAQEFLNRRSRIFDKWQEFTVTHELKLEVCAMLCGVWGGQQQTQVNIQRRLLSQNPPQHWGLGRTFLEKYGDQPAAFHYCAGQDMPYECKLIRKELTK